MATKKAKSLTEAARQVLSGQQIDEGLPAIGPISGGVSNPNPVDPSTASTSNAKTLHPGTGPVEPRHGQLGGGSGPESFPVGQDLGGATPTSLAKDNLGAKAAAGQNKDKSVKGAGTNTEPMKKVKGQVKEEEVNDDEVVDEELSLAERIKALKEARKAKKACMEEEHEEEGEPVEEEYEISEELEDFINQAIEAGLTEEEIQQAIEENFEIVEEEVEGEEVEGEQVEEEEAEPQISVQDYDLDMSEHVDALLEGENLSEEFHHKATTIFEAAVRAKLEEEVGLLEQAYAETLEERIGQIEEELTAQVDSYLNYVVEQWIEENEIAVESSLRSELTEDFITGLHALFAEHYINVPEEEVDIVEELASTVKELEHKLNEEIQTNVELSSVLTESRKVEITNAICEGLPATQVEKLKSLIENVAYTTDDEFIQKVETLKENYFPTSAKNDQVLDRVESKDPKMIAEENLDGRMGKYVSAIGKTSRNK